MTTRRWENKRIELHGVAGTMTVVVDPVVPSNPRMAPVDNRKWTGAEFIENMTGQLDEAAAEAFIQECDEQNSTFMREAALDDLRQQLADTRAERDRAQARNRELEARLETIRGVAR